MWGHDGYRSRSVRANDRLVDDARGAAGAHRCGGGSVLTYATWTVDCVYCELGDADFPLLPREAPPCRTSRLDEAAALQAYRNTFSGLESPGGTFVTSAGGLRTSIMHPELPRLSSWSRREMLGVAGRLATGAAAWASAGLPLGAQVSAVHTIASQVPGKDRRLIVHSGRPLDLETPTALLDEYLTPVESFYVRSHMAAPAVDAAAWRLGIDGDVTAPAQLSLEELQRLPSVSMVATLECAGNGRAFFDPPVAGIQWRRGAVGTARWTGVPLAHLLRRAGIRVTAAHLWASGLDRPFGSQPPFVRNLPIAKALDEHTLVAYAMNGRPLPSDHGFPVRLLVPGWEGAYSVKWLSRLTAAPTASDSFWVANAYRYPLRRVSPGAAVPPDQMAPLTGLVVKSFVTRPTEAAVVPPGPIMVAGYAWAGEQTIARVDVSIDGGVTWSQARLTGPRDRYAWRRFEHVFIVTQPQACTILSRATDAAGRTQPIVPAWNPSGYLWNAPDEVRIEVRA